MEEEQRFRIYFRKNLTDTMRYLTIKTVEEAKDAVEIFSNRYPIYNLETHTDNGWIVYRNQEGQELQQIIEEGLEAEDEED